MINIKKILSKSRQKNINQFKNKLEDASQYDLIDFKDISIEW